MGLLYLFLYLIYTLSIVMNVEENIGPKRDEVTGGRENYLMRSLMICTSHPLLCG
jgi:hypothetical protein